MLRVIISFAAALASAAAFQFFAGWFAGKKELKLEKKGMFLVQKRELLLTVLLFVFVLVRMWFSFGNTVQMILDWALMTGMTVLCDLDSRLYWVPTKFLYGMAGVWAVVVAVTTIRSVEAGIAWAAAGIGGALFAGIIFLVCFFVSKGQLGGGDVKLSFIMGLYLTAARILPALLIGSVLSCVFSLIQVARKKITWKDGVPMVPFLWAGAVAAILLSMRG